MLKLEKLSTLRNLKDDFRRSKWDWVK
jgi:hypothetical protein